MRAIEKRCDNIHVHIIQFEDLIYKYDEKINQIIDILRLDETAHSKKKTMFNPQKSINNTQLFMLNKYREEAKIIERELPEFLYDFPYINSTDVEKSF